MRRVRTGMLNTNVGSDPVTSLEAASAVATRAGFESSVGMTSPGAVRCERVMVPSELGHIITIGLPAI